MAGLPKHPRSFFRWRVWTALTLFIALIMTSLPASAATGFGSRTLELANDGPGVTTSYTLSFLVTTATNIGSFDILFCSNDPIQDDSCTIPAGLDVTNASVSASSGIGPYTLFPAATNDLVISQSPTSMSNVTVSLTFDSIINPSSGGPYYVRLSGYNSTNVTGPTVAYAGLAFSITNNLQISSYVPPYITFCTGLTISGFDCSTANGNYINIGNLAYTHSSQATSQMAIATNAANGYIIQVSGSSMTSGNNVLHAMSTAAPSVTGVSEFGINLKANTSPGFGADPSGPGSGQPINGYDIPNQFKFNDNDIIASSAAADDFRKFTVSYLVNVSQSQPPGVYATTLTYVASGSF